MLCGNGDAEAVPQIQSPKVQSPKVQKSKSPKVQKSWCFGWSPAQFWRPVCAGSLLLRHFSLMPYRTMAFPANSVTIKEERERRKYALLHGSSSSTPCGQVYIWYLAKPVCVIRPLTCKHSVVRFDCEVDVWRLAVADIKRHQGGPCCV